MAALHDTLRTSNLADNGPPWHPASRVLDDNSWSLRTTPHLSACMGVACTVPRTVGCVGCGIHCHELCRTTAHSRREITLVFAALAERGSRARFVRWPTDRLGSPTHYKPVHLQYSGGLL